MAIDYRFHADSHQLAHDTIRYQLLLENQTLSYSDIIRYWHDDALFRQFFISLLADSPFPAFLWECRPVDANTSQEDFEFVIINAPQLDGVKPDRAAFAEYYDTIGIVTVFENHGKDSTLIAPVPIDDSHDEIYSHIASFMRHAPGHQKHALLVTMAGAIQRSISAFPLWVSTSGLGVYWLHARLDKGPKYYNHLPYRHAI